MNSMRKCLESLATLRKKSGLVVLPLGLALGFAGGQMLHSDAADSRNSDVATEGHSGAPVQIHSGRITRSQKSSDLDAAINKMREFGCDLSLPSSMFEPWWHTMLHDPDSSWILRNFDVMSSNPDKNWTFPVGLGAYIPRLDTTETGDDIKITAEVPGIDEKDLDVTVTDDSVTIKGDKRAEATQKASRERAGFQAIERSYGSFERTIALPSKVESNNAQASLKNGVLTITVPKSHVAQSEGRKLTIRRE